LIKKQDRPLRRPRVLNMKIYRRKAHRYQERTVENLRANLKSPLAYPGRKSHNDERAEGETKPGKHQSIKECICGVKKY